ncbi:hypothetical protein TrLO_g7532 [Triparma laevis f. longispina]|uniref:Uncharacterized protein n=1 Tax=Triparma laevis f. longispina TaxID=1714387 RepID=A0A9W7CFI0_9STRA|nr:hypothetical protein TrLO_g7532 [Triparma laevis f. longispina]
MKALVDDEFESKSAVFENVSHDKLKQQYKWKRATRRSSIGKIEDVSPFAEKQKSLRQVGMKKEVSFRFNPPPDGGQSELMILAKLDAIERQQSKLNKDLLKQADRVIGKMEDSMEPLMTFTFECSEFDLPRTFTILPYKIEVEGSADGKYDVATTTAGSMDKATSWIVKLTSLVEVVESEVANVRKAAASNTNELFKGYQSEKLYLHLVDEVTNAPVL